MDKVSYFVVDNLHCPSCIFTVKSTLSDELNIPATNVSVSLVNQTITVRHNESITQVAIAHALAHEGFDVEYDRDQDDPHGTGHSWLPNPLAGHKRKRRHREICKSCQAEHRAAQKEKKSLIPRISMTKSRSENTDKTVAVSTGMELIGTGAPEVTTQFAISGMTCASCSKAITEGLKAHRSDGILSCNVDVMSNSAKVVHDGMRITPQEIAKLITDLGYTAEVVDTRRVSRRQRPTSQDFPTDYRLEFHIGGMTCTSCSSGITNGLQDEPYIKSVNINLMANSGTAILSNKEDAERVKVAVESMGYSCDLGEIAPLRPLTPSAADDIRIVRIHVDGMFCR
jgi:P-type Cu+ transporter